MTSCWKCWELWDCGKSALRAGGLGLSTRGRSFASAQIGRSQPVTLGDPFSEWLLLYGGILVEGVVVVPRLAGSADPQVQTRALGVAAGFARKRAVSVMAASRALMNELYPGRVGMSVNWTE